MAIDARKKSEPKAPPHGPAIEKCARIMFGIESVPPTEAKRMVRRLFAYLIPEVEKLRRLSESTARHQRLAIGARKCACALEISASRLTGEAKANVWDTFLALDDLIRREGGRK
jgi:hypothetical protein